MKRPERLKIISKRFTVGYMPAGEGGLPEDCNGLCLTQEQEILVEDALKPDTERDTVWHEVIHAISDEMVLGLTEPQVEGLAKGTLSVFMDNPSFRRYLLAK